jgi:hypothetical protein
VRLADLEAVADSDQGAAGAAWACTACMMGLKRAMAPERR